MIAGFIEFVQWLFITKLISENNALMDALLNHLLVIEENLSPGETLGEDYESLCDAYEKWTFEESYTLLEMQGYLETELRVKFPEFDRFIIRSKARQN